MSFKEHDQTIQKFFEEYLNIHPDKQYQVKMFDPTYILKKENNLQTIFFEKVYEKNGLFIDLNLKGNLKIVTLNVLSQGDNPRVYPYLTKMLYLALKNPHKKENMYFLIPLISRINAVLHSPEIEEDIYRKKVVRQDCKYQDDYAEQAFAGYSILQALNVDSDEWFRKEAV